MGAAGNFWSTSRAVGVASLPSIKITFGELSAYDSTTHTGKFNLMVFPDQGDPSDQTPIETSFMQIMTPWSGNGLDPTGNPTGAQWQPAIGSQGLVLFADEAGMHPICGLLLFNAVDQPPYPDGRSSDWKDASGSHVRTSMDGATYGDDVGSAKIQGNAYTGITTAATYGTAGHTLSMDNIAQTIQALSGGGHSVLLNDLGKIVSIVSSGGHTLHLDDLGQVVSLTSTGGHLLHMDDVSEVMALIPHGSGSPALNLGAMSSGLAKAITHVDIDNMLNVGTDCLNNQRLIDAQKILNAVASCGGGISGWPSYATLIAALASFVNIPVPNGSSIVNIAT